MGEKGLAEKSEDGSDTAEPDNEGPSHEADEPPDECGIYLMHLGAEVSVVRLRLSAEVSSLRLEPANVRLHYGVEVSEVGLHFGAKVSDVGLGGEVVVDRFESGESLFDGGHGAILA